MSRKINYYLFILFGHSLIFLVVYNFYNNNRVENVKITNFTKPYIETTENIANFSIKNKSSVIKLRFINRKKTLKEMCIKFKFSQNSKQNVVFTLTPNEYALIQHNELYKFITCSIPKVSFMEQKLNNSRVEYFLN